MIQFLLAAAGLLAAITALCTMMLAIVKSPLGKPIKWLWNRNVAIPARGWFQSAVGEVVDERIDYLMHHRNSGSSLLDLAESVERVNSAVGMLLRHDAERDTAGKRYGAKESTD